MKALIHAWHHDNFVSKALAPLAWLFGLIVMLRRIAYRCGLRPVAQLPVPVIVVGNISVGGTGKTPLVVWIIRALQEAGYRPGIISRGYGGKAITSPMRVVAASDPAKVGDEPVLLARQCHCPIAVCSDRVAAARMLVDSGDCDILVSDDGLQHYALGRDIEIAVIDGLRRFGNGRLLPAGPLREPQRRLRHVDCIVTTGTAQVGEFPMALNAHCAVSLRYQTDKRPLAYLAGRQAHAIAGIGHPARFFTLLREHGIHVIEHAYPDHFPFQAKHITFDDDIPVLMTEKDAVKCQRFAQECHWYIPVEASLPSEFHLRFFELLKTLRPAAA